MAPTRSRRRKILLFAPLPVVAAGAVALGVIPADAATQKPATSNVILRCSAFIAPSFPSSEPPSQSAVNFAVRNCANSLATQQGQLLGKNVVRVDCGTASISTLGLSVTGTQPCTLTLKPKKRKPKA